MDIIIVDANALGNRMNAVMKLSSGTMPVGAIFGFLKAIGSIRKQYPKTDIMVLWDGRAQWRFDLYPDYKSNRSDPDPKKVAEKEMYKKQVPVIRKGLEYLGVKQMIVTSAEADDRAGYMTMKLAKLNKKILLMTGDKDWLQLVQPGVTWFDPINDRTVDSTNFFEFTGYPDGESFLQGKALMGDNSDCIPGVGGIGEKGAPLFLAEFRSVFNFFKQCEAGEFVPKKKAHVEFATEQGKKAFARNYKLMNLRSVEAPPSDDVFVTRGEFNPDRFRALCERLAFASILREFTDFTEPFRPAK